MNLQGIIKKSYIFLSLFLLFVINNTAISQTPTDQDCLGAIVVCDPSYYQLNSYSGQGNYPNEINAGLSCLNSGEKNDVWYMVTVQSDGDLGFLLTPNQGSDDYDWAVYNLTIARCEDIFSNASLEVSCNYSGTSGPTGPNGGSGYNNQGASGTPYNAMIPVQQGQTYVINISNYTSSQSGYTLDFGISTAQIYDNVRPTISQVYGDDITCGDNTIDFLFSENVMCASVSTSSFTLTGPGGPYTITNVYGEACDVGGDMEKEYTLTVNPAFSVNGSYSLNIVQFSGISDACGNIALPQQFPFDIDLGAPEVIESNLSISSSTCGNSNGAITDLIISGTSPFTYEWTDASNNIVGTELDLVNVPAGLYTLLVSDPNTCESIGGPYQVDDEGAPVIDASNIFLTDNYCGETNGSITGIQATGSTNLSYQWTDELNNVVGTELDLTNIVGGTYILKITDENSCEAFSDSYTIEDKPGPVIDETIMVISNASCNENTGSIKDILVSGDQLTFEWTDENSNVVGNEVDLFNVGPGNYSLKTNNLNNCEVVLGPYEVINIGGVALDDVLIQNPTCELNNGYIEITATGGYGNRWYSIDVDTVWTNNGFFENLSPATYNVLVKDDYDCILPSTNNPIILENMGAAVVANASADSPFCTEDDLELNCDFSGADIYRVIC